VLCLVIYHAATGSRRGSGPAGPTM
jgi:hypothetical protein